MAKIRKDRQISPIRKALEASKRNSVNDMERIGNFKLSFQYLDITQPCCSTFSDWQNAGVLDNMMNTLSGYCKKPLLSQVDGDKFTIYHDFPPSDKTDFVIPPHVPIDACWARIHIGGKLVVAGHIVEDTFYVVFLDMEHRFWLTKRVTGK